jgi:hypothetical protein
MLSMMDLRRSAAPLRAARLAALAAVLTFMCLLTAASAARASNGEIASWGGIGNGAAADQFIYAGPTAVDPSDGNAVYVADFKPADYVPRLRKYAANGTLKATVLPPVDNPGGDGGRIVALAVDSVEHRVYVLLSANGSPDRVSGFAASMTILAYSTQESGGTLVKPSDLTSETLIDFRTAGGWVDSPSAIAVDPSNNDVAIIGNRDSAQSDPTGVIQFVHDDGTLGARVTGLGANVDPAGSGAVPAGMAIDKDGKLYIPVTNTLTHDVAIYRLPQGGGTPAIVATDPANNGPENLPSQPAGGIGYGVPIAVSPDARTVWLAEGNASVGTGGVRGFDTATGDQVISYGGGTTSCNVPNRSGQLAVSAGSGDQVFVTSSYNDEADQPGDALVHVFGPGGTGCPMPQGLFTINNRGDGTVTVTKGQSVAFDASLSDLRGGSAGGVDWDFDGSGDFGTVIDGAAGLRTTYTFTTLGTFRVGVQVHIQGGVTTEPVFHTVTVVAPRPTAAFTASTRTPAAGGTVSFDATNSIDPGQSGAGAHRLKSYTWDFGDGSAPVTTTTPTTSHAFANAGAATLNRTVRLVVVSADDVSSDPFSQSIAVGGTPTQTQTQTQTTTTPTTPTTTTPGPRGTNPPVVTFPQPTLGSPAVDARGTASFTLRCPSGGNPCTGTIVLTTKVTKKVRGRKKVTTVKLGTVTFSVDAGKSKVIKVKLSATGRSLLKRSKRLAASAAITLKVSGQSKSTTKALTLKTSAAKKH